MTTYHAILLGMATVYCPAGIYAAIKLVPVLEPKQVDVATNTLCFLFVAMVWPWLFWELVKEAVAEEKAAAERHNIVDEWRV